ncbi:hypothetical protein BJV82DRAFT_617371 [Fennellomyces sp. T-0311]|nr:hypothetical protein BJV82DRAFT_617371 [Fennellomyces sp. T-0311]
MSLQSLIRREGWRPHTLAFLGSARTLCRNCLSRRMAAQPPIRAHVSVRTFLSRPQQQQQQAMAHVPESIQKLRTQLYDPPFPSRNQLKRQLRLGRMQGRVHNVIVRRIQRIQVMQIYREIRRDANLLEALTHEDIESMLRLFSAYYPRGSDQTTKMAAEILHDLSVQRPALFTEKDAEMMVCFYATYGETTQAEKAMQGLIYGKHVPSEKAYDALIHSLAAKGDMEGVGAWVSNMQANGLAPTSTTVRSMVDGWLGLGDENKAIQLLREYGANIDKLGRKLEQGESDRVVLDTALSVFGDEAINEWLLYDAMRFYRYRQERKMDTRGLVRHLVDTALYTLQPAVAHDMLAQVTQSNDPKAKGLIANKLLNYYLARGNSSHAFDLWKQMPGVFGPNKYISLYDALARTNRQEQLMRLYRAMRKRYPQHISIELYNTGLRSFVRNKSYDYALGLYQDMIADKIPPGDMTKDMFYSLYSLCAQTGRTDLFREVLEVGAQAGMDMDYKTMSSLMACYTESGDIKAAKQVFEAIAESHGPDVVDFNLLIRATAKEEDSVDFSKILKILQHMSKVQVEPDASTYRTLLDIYRDGEVEQQLFERLLSDPGALKLDRVFLNNIALTREVERYGPHVAATKFMKDDRSALFPGTERVPIQANNMTYKILMDALVDRPKLMHVCDRLYQTMRKKGWLPYRPVYEHMILGWARKGRIQRARRLMQEMEEDLCIKSDIRIYTMLVDGLLLRNKLDLAVQVVEEIQSLGLQADDVLLDRIERFELDSYNKLAPSPV